MPKTASLVYSVDNYTSTIPAVSAATYAALQGMDTTSALTLNFNSFQANPAGFGLTQLLFSSASDPGVSRLNSVIPNTANMSFAVAANALLPGTTYTLTIQLLNRTAPSSGGVATNVISGVNTRITFTTGGGLTQVSLEKDIIYLQTSGSPPTTPTIYQAFLGVDFRDPGNFDGATVAYPGPGSPQTLNQTGPDLPNLFFQSPILSSQAALDAAFPHGSYQFKVTNSATSASIGHTVPNGRLHVRDPGIHRRDVQRATGNEHGDASYPQLQFVSAESRRVVRDDTVGV